MKYEDRLKSTGLTTLEERRNRRDMLEVYKILTGKCKTNSNNFFSVINKSTSGGHKLKLMKSRNRLDVRNNFFCQRIVNQWNKLPEYIVEAENINCFKNRYYQYYKN